MRDRYCEFLKVLAEKEYEYEDVSALLDSIEEFEDELNDEYGEDEVDEIISDLSVLRNKIENWQIESVADFNDKLKDHLLSELEHFE